MKDKNNPITVYVIFPRLPWSPSLKFSTYYWRRKKKQHTYHPQISLLFSISLVTFPLFEYKQKNIFYYYLNCYDNSVYLPILPHNTKICFRKSRFNLSTRVSKERMVRAKQQQEDGPPIADRVWKLPCTCSHAGQSPRTVALFPGSWGTWG